MDGCVAVQRLVSAALMIILEKLFEETHQVPLGEDDHVVKQLPANRPDQSVHEWRLPRRSRCNYDLLDPHAPQTAPQLAAIDAVAVVDQVARRRVEGEGLPQLLGNPRSGRALTTV